MLRWCVPRREICIRARHHAAVPAWCLCMSQHLVSAAHVKIGWSCHLAQCYSTNRFLTAAQSAKLDHASVQVHRDGSSSAGPAVSEQQGATAPSTHNSAAIHSQNHVGRSRFLQLPRLVKTAGECSDMPTAFVQPVACGADAPRNMQRVMLAGKSRPHSEGSVTGTTAAQLTAANLDKSGLLEQTIAEAYGGRQEALLAEFQYAFITFLFGQSLEGAPLGLTRRPTLLASHRVNPRCIWLAAACAVLYKGLVLSARSASKAAPDRAERC